MATAHILAAIKHYLHTTTAPLMLGTYFFSIALLFGYIGSIFTHSIFFPAASFLSAWTLVFAPLHYPYAEPDILVVRAFVAETFFYVPVLVIAGTFIGIGIVKCLGLGQLIDITLTGGAGGDNSEGEELNIPFTTGVAIFTLLAIFFVSAATDSNFMYMLYAPTPWVMWLFAVLSILIAVVLLLVSATQYKRGGIFHNTIDIMTIWYTAMFAAIVTIQYFISSWATVIGAIIILLVDIAFFGLGILVERWQDEEIATGIRHSRFLAIENTGIQMILRFFTVIGVHIGLYVLASELKTAFGSISLMITAPIFLWIIGVTLGVLVLLNVVSIILRQDTACCGAQPEKGAQSNITPASTPPIGKESIVSVSARSNITRRTNAKMATLQFKTRHV